MNENQIAREIVDCCYRIHTAMGPSLLESAYETMLEHELKQRGLVVKRQWPIPLVYDGVKLQDGFRADLIVNERVIVEVKAVDCLAPVHAKQLLTYLRVSGIKLGLLANFDVVRIRDGIRRPVNRLPDLPEQPIV